MQNTDIDPRKFRDILGHSPTSVAAVTAINDAGKPIGMVVGTFTSVSLDPPLIGFLPDRGSSTFPLIREARSFCINILSAAQESVCRQMSARQGDRFKGIDWHPSPSGAPVIDGSVAWIDCVPETIFEAGDHFIFIGRVTDMAVVNPTFPLVFFQGGYGAFASRSMVIGAREGLAEQIRLADSARNEMEELANAVGAVCRLIAVDGDRQIVVASAGGEDSAPISLVGVSMPLVPPLFGQLFNAWESPETVDSWLKSSPVPVDGERREGLLAQLDTIRREGWMVGWANNHTSEAAAALDAMAVHGQTPRLEREIVEISAKIGGVDNPNPLADDAAAANVKYMFAPIFDSDQHAQAGIMLVNLPEQPTLEYIKAAKERLLASASSITRRSGGVPPASYPSTLGADADLDAAAN